MNMIHACNSNKFIQWKQGGHYITGTVQSYVHQTISNVSRCKLTFTTVYYYIYVLAGSSIKLVKIGGSSKPPNPLVMGLQQQAPCSIYQPGTA